MVSIVGNWGGGSIWQVISESFPSNSYICEAAVPGGCILIDAGLDGELIDLVMSERGLSPYQVFCTHGHFDHIGSADFFQKKYGCQIFMHKADTRTVKASNFLLMALNIPQRIKIPEITFLENDHVINVDGHSLTYLAAPGHTPGSCVLQFGSAWFTGDTIYSQGVGLSSLPGEDPIILKQSILRLWDQLLVERIILPGHGSPTNNDNVRLKNRALLKFLGLAESADK